MPEARTSPALASTRVSSSPVTSSSPSRVIRDPDSHQLPARDRDGHDFVAHAVARGAVALMVHREGDYRVPAIRVEDTLDALWDLGRAARRRLDCPGGRGDRE